MPTLATNFNWGSALKNENPVLTRQLSEAFTMTALVVNNKTSKYISEDQDPPNPATAAQINKNFEIGDFWIRKDTDTAWMMTSRATDLLVTWTQLT